MDKDIVWKPCKGYEGLYEVSSDYRVRNARNGKLIRLERISDGFNRCDFYVKGSRIRVNVKKIHDLSFYHQIFKKPSKKKIYFKRKCNEKNIRYRSDIGQYEVRIRVDGKYETGCFKTIDDAKLFRHTMELERNYLKVQKKDEKVKRKYVVDKNLGVRIDVSKLVK